MPLFVISCIALVAFVLATLAPALLNRKRIRSVDLDQINLEIARQRLQEISALSEEDLSDEQKQARGELEATLADDLKGPAYDFSNQRSLGMASTITILLIIPIAAALIYNRLGLSDWQQRIAQEKAVQEQTMAQAGSSTEEAGNARASLDVLLNRIEQKLEENPENPQGWTLAARTYMSIGDFVKAEKAFAEADRLVGPDPDILTAWTDATLMVNGNVFTDDVDRRIQKALELEPEQINALWIAGLGANARGDNASAINYFRRVKPLIANDTEATRQVNQMLTDLGVPAEALLVAKTNAISPASGNSSLQSETASTVNQQSPAAMSVVQNQTGNENGAERTIDVTVRIDNSVGNQANPGDPVFIFVKAPSGPPFPLAAVRITVQDLPTTVRLDNSTAMMPNMNISGFEQVVVAARVSKTGDPIAKPGDLTSNPKLVDTAANPQIELLINQVVN